MPDKITDKNCRKDHLKQRAAGDHHEFAKKPKKQMSRFVDRQIDIIEKAALHRIVSDPEKIDAQ